MKWKLKEINNEVKQQLYRFYTNESVIEKLMNGEALEELSSNEESVCFTENAGWVRRELLVKVKSPIDVVKSESKKF